MWVAEILMGSKNLVTNGNSLWQCSDAPHSQKPDSPYPLAVDNTVKRLEQTSCSHLF